MNGRYFILPNARYVQQYPDECKVFIDDMNNVLVNKGKWTLIESFNQMDFSFSDKELTLEQAFDELGYYSEEKGQLLIFEGKNKETFFFYNSVEEIPEFKWNSFKFVDILFESREKMLESKIISYLEYVYFNNLDNIKNLATTETIKDINQLLENIQNDNFIATKLTKKDRILLKEIYFLARHNFFGWADTAYVYTFIEEGGKLRPVRFETSFSEYKVAEQAIDKADVLLSIQKKQIVNLLFDKIESHTLFSKKKFFTKKDLQAFYDTHIKKNKITSEHK